MDLFPDQEETLVLQEKEEKISKLQEQLQSKAEAEEKLEKQRKVSVGRTARLALAVPICRPPKLLRCDFGPTCTRF